MIPIDIVNEIKKYCEEETALLYFLSTTSYYFEYRLHILWMFKHQYTKVTEKIQNLPYYNNFGNIRLDRLSIGNLPKNARSVQYTEVLNVNHFPNQNLKFLKKVLIQVDRCDANRLNHLFSYPSIQSIEITCPVNLEYIKFPPMLKTLILFDTYYNLCTPLPKTLEKLYFINYNQPLYQLPPHIKKLSLGTKFNRKISKEDLPPSLLYLHLGNAYNQTLPPEILPTGIIELIFGDHYNRNINPGVIPSTVKKLELGYHYTRKIKQGTLPEGLEILTLRCKYNRRIPIEVIPLSLKKLRVPFGKVLMYRHLRNQWFDILGY